MPSRASLLAVAFTLCAVACQDPTKGKPAAIVGSAIASASVSVAPIAKVETTRWNLSPETLKVGFVGSKVTGKHEGTFPKVRGTVAMIDRRIEAAIVAIVVEIGSVKTEDTELDDHLKSKDFFDATRFPLARFTSTTIVASTAPSSTGQASTHTVTGNLELHGVSRSISFPATITLDGGALKATAEFSIKRKDFGIVYPGKPDDLIRDDVLLKLSIDAKSAS
ncbi:MAG: YceI family protein [Polyangiales bacterium]